MRKRGPDLRHDLEISLKHAGEGLTTTLTAGLAEREFNIQVEVPPGVDTGSRLRFGRKGEAGIGNEERGDLYIVIRVLEHEIFKRKGAIFRMQGLGMPTLLKGRGDLYVTLVAKVEDQ